MKVALVHDELTHWGGGERLFLGIAEIFPNAPIYTSIYDLEILKFAPELANREIRTTFLQKLPFKKFIRRLLLPLYPIAFETLDLSEFDLIISSSARFAHGVITKPGQRHIAYINSPPRFIWESKNYLENEKFKLIIKILIFPILGYLRSWDKVAFSRPDVLIANSENVAAKIRQLHNKEAAVLYPFVDLERHSPFAIRHSRENKTNSEKLMDNSYFLIVSRLIPWKKIDIAVRACQKLKKPLVVVGDGPHKRYLRKIVKDGIVFFSNVSDEKLKELYQNCKAVIITQEEDFGLVALEAQAFGKAVIGYKAGGSLETIIEGKTGLFFDEQSEEVLAKAIEKFDKISFNAKDSIVNAKRFSKQNFQEKFLRNINGTKSL